MNVCILGGRGFVGSAVTETMRKRGHDVTTLDPAIGGDRTVLQGERVLEQRSVEHCDHHISADILSMDLDEHLQGFDVVVNLVGLSPMIQPGTPGYHDLHVAGAENVVAACEKNDIARLVHMSALGADPDADMAFLATKGLGEQVVLDAEDAVDVTVFKPSIIYDRGNELVRYAELFAPTRLFPDMPTPIQPVYRGDMAALFAEAVDGHIEESVLEVGGPDTMTMFQFVKQIYNANGYACYRLPVLPLMTLGLRVMEYVPFAPWGRDQARFLTFDNTTDDTTADRYVDVTSYEDWVTETYGDRR